MSHPVNDEILENLYEEICDEYPAMEDKQRVALAEKRFNDMCY